MDPEEPLGAGQRKVGRGRGEERGPDRGRKEGKESTGRRKAQVQGPEEISAPGQERLAGREDGAMQDGGGRLVPVQPSSRVGEEPTPYQPGRGKDKDGAPNKG